MTTFVLVHGAWHGSWCWKRVRKTLQAAGHEVFTPTLTGVGERSHLLAREVDLRTHQLDVMNLLRWEELDDVVLCGHSYAGFVVSGVADAMPERLRALIYLDAFVPEHGECLANLAPVAGDELVDGWKTPPIPAAAFNVNAADLAWVDRQCTLQSLACFQQPLQLTGGLARVPRVRYLFASGWAEGNPIFRPQYERAKARGWDASEIACGHDVMLDQPEALTRYLLES